MQVKIRPVLKIIAEKVVDPVVRFFNFPLAYLAGRSEDMGKAIMRPALKSFTNQSRDWIVQYVQLPKNVDKIPAEWPDDNRFAGYAIVLQGPVRTAENFTVETVKYYKRCYPGATVIVSTWTGSDAAAKAAAEKLIERGCRKLLHLGSINRGVSMPADMRAEGFREVCQYAIGFLAGRHEKGEGPGL